MNPILKLLLFPLAILASIAAGSIFSELNNFLLYESKYNIDAETVSWFSFAVNASVLVGYVPSKLYRKLGPKRTILFGGLLITIAHVLAIITLNTNLGRTAATIALFLVGVIGGQGALIVFLTALGAVLKMHSIISTSLINGIMFTYFIGSDAFHQALKVGIFTNFTVNQFLLIVAVLGALIYVACAILFQKKAQKESSSKSLAKGMALKKTVSFYALVLCAFVIMTVLLLISYQSNSYWGSRVLVLILALNLFVPLLSIAMVDTKNLGSMFSKPGPTDQFLSSRGKNCNFSEARKKPEFWLFLAAFAIIIAISDVNDDRASAIAYNVSQVERNRRTFQVFELVGSFATGVFLALFRIYISPYGCLMFNALLVVVSQILLLFFDVTNNVYFWSYLLVSFASGSSYVLAGQVAHEDYGDKHFGKILGIFLTGAAVALLVFEKFIFDYMYSYLKPSNGWNSTVKQIIFVHIVAGVIAFLFALVGYIKTRKSDGNKDKIAEFVKF